jgi:hypothetical protein
LPVVLVLVLVLVSSSLEMDIVPAKRGGIPCGDYSTGRSVF